MSQKTLGHANIGLSKLILENEHKADLLNFVTGINLFALQLNDSVCDFPFRGR